LLQVSSIEINATLEHWNEFLWWIEFVIPKNIVTLRSTFLSCLTISNSNKVKNVEFAVGNHLVGDLNEQTCHSLISVVVSSNGMDHFDAVHQSWENFLN
jgi:hypothetical protein